MREMEMDEPSSPGMIPAKRKGTNLDHSEEEIKYESSQSKGNGD